MCTVFGLYQSVLMPSCEMPAHPDAHDYSDLGCSQSDWLPQLTEKGWGDGWTDG